MKEFETENYIFHFEENSLAARDIKKIAEYQEKCYKYLCSVLKVNPNFKIQFFYVKLQRK